MGRKSNDSGCGCGIIPWLIIIAGNLLIITGKLFTDLVDNELAWIICIVAFGADIYFIYKLVSRTQSNHQSSNNMQNSSSRSSPGLKPYETSQQPNQQGHSDRSKLKDLIDKYNVPPVPSTISNSDPLQKAMASYQCIEINQAVKKLVRNQLEIREKLRNLKKEIDSLLACPECLSDSERIKYLKKHKETLSEKREEYLSLLSEIENNKIQLLNRERNSFTQLINSLELFSDSRKIVNNCSISYDKFIQLSSVLPGNIFYSSQDPIRLSFEAYNYYLLPDTILVFTNENEFVTALEPMSLIIDFRDKRKNVYNSKNGTSGWRCLDNLVSDDSILVSRGNVSSTWMHTRKDGGPDLRYSHNPIIETRTDIYSCTDLTIQIGDCKAAYAASKGDIAKKLKFMVRPYCSISHELNAIPSLLRLLEYIADNGNNAAELIYNYENNCDDIICREVKL